MWNEILLTLLHRLAPERAHRVAVWLMRLYQRVLVRMLKRPLPKRLSIHVMPSLSIRFRNRLGLAAGFDKNAEMFAALSRVGFGFVEVGTVTPHAQPGNPKPRIFRISPDSLVNRLGFNNEGAEVFRRNILKYRDYVEGVPIFANIGKGKTTPLEYAARDYATLISYLENCVDGFVINVSSPNTPGLRSLQSDTFLSQIAGLLPEKPCWVKLAPDLSNDELKSLLLWANEVPRLTGVVLTNTSVELAKKRGYDEGGLSGPPLFERALQCVSLARETLHSQKMIIGVGGVSSADDFQKMREAGADLVEIYTGFVYKGPKLVREIAEL